MFAIVKIQGKQYKVQENDIINIEKLPESVEINQEVELDIVMAEDKQGKVKFSSSALKKDLHIKATLLERFTSRKIIVFKKRRRKNYRRKHGHKQQMCKVKIESINLKSNKMT